MLKSNKALFIKVFVVLIFIIIPFSLSDYSDNVSPEKITSDLRFYEINTCSISLGEFLFKNPNVIYQDHYKIRFNNYSSINCFGQITGIDQIGFVFYISIGTNTVINLFLQSGFWILLLSFFRKKRSFDLNFFRILSSSISAILFCFLIYSESRFYSKNIFLMDLTLKSSYLYIFSYMFIVCFFSSIIIESRQNNIINFIPFLYIVIGLYSGMNLYFWMIPFVVFGVENIFKNKKIRKSFYLINPLIFFWSYQATGIYYYLKPDKIRGLSLTSYNFLSVFVWSYIIVVFLFGIVYFLKRNYKNFNFEILSSNFLYTSTIILILGYFGASMPLARFLNFYYFGQTKFGTDNQYLFAKSDWGEIVAWRGFYPSAETIGEFFALSILIFLISKIKDNFTYSKNVLFLPFSFLGLYLSNNKSATFLLIFSSLLLIVKNYNIKNNYKLAFFLISLAVLLVFIRLENFFFSFDFIGDKIYEMSYIYGFDYDRSAAFNYLSIERNKNSLVYILFSFFSSIAFLINRSELWGLYFARYNPNFSEFLLGTGFYSLSNHYSEVNISSTRVNTGDELGFLLPHSSFLLIFMSVGMIGFLIFGLFMTLYGRRLKKINYDMYILLIFILINLFKSDSILYFSSLFCYISLIYSEKRKESKFEEF